MPVVRTIFTACSFSRDRNAEKMDNKRPYRITVDRKTQTVAIGKPLNRFDWKFTDEDFLLNSGLKNFDQG